MKNSMLVFVAIFSLGCLSGCGLSTPPPPFATHFSVTPAANTATAGKAFNFTVTALDATGAVVASFSDSVHFNSSDTQAILPPNSTLTNGSGTFSVTFKALGNQTIEAADATSPSISSSSATITVFSNSASQFSVITSSGTLTAGGSVNVTVTALDALNNVVTGYTGTAHFSSSDIQATLPADTTLKNGTGTFPVVLKTAGNEFVTVIDTAMASITGNSPAILVSAGPAIQLSVKTPMAITAGLQFNAPVRALDAFSNQAVTYSGTVHFTSTDTQAVLPADVMLTGGSAPFPFTLKTIGNQSITVKDTAPLSTITPGLSGPINVFTNAATHFSFSGHLPAEVTRETLHFTITALDAANNISIVYAGAVHFTSTDAQAILPANSTLTAGTASFAATFETAGNQTLTATDTTLTSVTGSAAFVVSTPAPLVISAAFAPPNGTVGVVYGRHVPTTEYFDCFNQGGVIHCSFTLIRDRLCNHAHTNIPCWTGQTRVVNILQGLTFHAAGGMAPYSWSASSLPPGLTLNSVGEIFGTPTSPGPFTIKVTGTDSGNPSAQSASGNFPVTIAPPPAPVVNTTPPPPPFVVNKPHSYTFTATGYPPLTWNEAGALPTGLMFDDNTGTLSGTPTQTGSFTITVTATDQFKQASTATDNFTIVVTAHGFVATGSMGTARRFHTATLLGSGKVLVAGGEDFASNAFASAVLYDPSNGMFTPTKGGMTVARVGHTATLLNNGKVLLAGGTSTVSEAAISTAELYDPATDTFTATTGNMTAARASHTATRLNDGTVLVAGGGVIFFNGVGHTSIMSLSSAEIFNPNTGTFTATAGPMAMPRESHVAALLSSGKVLIAGGSDGALGINMPATTVYASSEVYDPSTGHFTAAGSMNAARDLFTATLLNTGKVLVAGGVNTTASLQSADLYDPSSTSFAATGNLMELRFYQDATLLNDGTVLITGGNGATGGLATAEIYEPTAGTFAITGSMIQVRVWHTATLLKDGTVLVTGGGTPPLATCELYK